MARASPDQAPYWNRVAEQKTCAHPLPLDWLAPLARTARVLDLGFTCLIGLDTAAAMIARGRRESPELDLRHHGGGALPSRRSVSTWCCCWPS